jgi:hypothetical protein
VAWPKRRADPARLILQGRRTRRCMADNAPR